MPTQVRIFTMPRSLDETLAAEPTQNTTTPRSVPDGKDFWRNVEPPKPKYQYQPKIPMAVYKDTPAEEGITFAGQDKLPKLPVPELEGTIERYLAALKPLQSVRERAETKHAVQEFLKHDGPELQERLKKYAVGKTSYIEQFCMASHIRDC
jgi:carnitine O-acetyltransferase